MRWCAGGWVVAGMVLLAACGTSAGRGSAGGPSGSRSSGPSADAPASTSTSAPSSPARADPSVSATPSPVLPQGCAGGRTDVTVTPGGAAEQRLCVRPGTVVSLILRPRTDDKRWTAVHSSAPALVLASGWKADADGTARASLRCATVRAGAADVTVLAKAPDVAGAARPAFTLHVSVVPYPTQG
jgi:hypothetical protein